MKRVLSLLFLLLFAMPAWAGGPALQRGVNLSHWLQDDGRQKVTAEDLALLRREGFDHVRLPLNPAYLGWIPEKPADLPRADVLKAAMALVMASELDLVLDLHLDDQFKAKLEKDESLEPAVITLWQELARLAAAFPSGKVAFELMNEPQYYGANAGKHWWAFQAQLAAAARAAAPGRLLLLTGPQGGDVATLVQAPPPDKEAAYVFHFYQPYIFTHQGAEWMADDKRTAAASMHDLPYPAEKVSAIPEGRAAAEVARYRADKWNALRIRQSVDQAAGWAHWNNVRIICTEFGVLRTHVDEVSRYAWIADTRRSLESLGIGWTVWDYADIFGIAAGTPRQLDEAARQALGLGRGRGE
jgi:endoglucanase